MAASKACEIPVGDMCELCRRRPATVQTTEGNFCRKCAKYFGLDDMNQRPMPRDTGPVDPEETGF